MTGITDLRGKVAVVTGGASGIGKGIAGALLGEGMQVVIADVDSSTVPSMRTTTPYSAVPERFDYCAGVQPGGRGVQQDVTRQPQLLADVIQQTG